ncbi:MAG TPA: hypothetical protein VD908_08310 [Cytophagales bacterium]|nr:hypothetical protein [Cytophagales bacterium]
MVRIFITAFLIGMLHFSCNSQSMVDVFKSVGLFGGKRGELCKPKATYQESHKPYSKRRMKVKSSLPPYQYIYNSKSAAPPRTSDSTPESKAPPEAKTSNQNQKKDGLMTSTKQRSTPDSKGSPP